MGFKKPADQLDPPAFFIEKYSYNTPINWNYELKVSVIV
jgi:hypothetical protein